MFLSPSPPPKAVPAAGRFFLPLTPFLFRFLPCPSKPARATQKLWLQLQRRPSHSRLLYQGVLHRRRSPPRPPVRMCQSLPCLALRPLRRRQRADKQRQQQVMHSAVYYGFGPGGTPRPSFRGGTTPPRVPRPRTALPSAATLALADSPVRTGPIASDRYHAEPIWELLFYGSRRLLVPH